MVFLIFNAYKNNLVIDIAETRDMITPRPKVSAKPWITDVPNMKSIKAVIILEVLESRIDSHARSNPV